MGSQERCMHCWLLKADVRVCTGRSREKPSSSNQLQQLMATLSELILSATQCCLLRPNRHPTTHEPRSTGAVKPSAWNECTRPPSRSRASSTVTSAPLRCSRRAAGRGSSQTGQHSRRGRNLKLTAGREEHAVLSVVKHPLILNQ